MRKQLIACIATMIITAACIFLLPRHPLTSAGLILLGASCLLQGALLIRAAFRRKGGK